MECIKTIEDLEALYGVPSAAATVKVATRITPEYRAWIEAAPFCALATAGPEGLDASPRGDRGAVAHVLDDRTLALPDRRGNNRIDSLRNIVRDPRVAIMFLIPGSGTVIRVNGIARIAVDPYLRARYAVDGKQPRSVILVTAAEVYFQCARAVMRACLWDAPPENLSELPSVGQILAARSKGEIDGTEYDRAWPKRAVDSMW